MPDGPGRFAQNFTCSALLRIPLRLVMLRIRDYHPLRCFFPEASPHNQSTTARSYYPQPASLRDGFGLFPGRSPLLGESLNYFLFLQVLRCFSSLRLPYQKDGNDCPSDSRVVPFGKPELQFYFTVFACVNKSKNVNTSNCQKAKTDGCVENNGFEPLTPCLQSRCSSQLS